VSRQPGGDKDASGRVGVRSWTVLHRPHCQARRLSGWGPSRCPHAQQRCEVGSQRPTLRTWRPWWAALSSSSRTKIAHPASWTLLASRVRANPATARSSTATTWCSRISRRASLWCDRPAGRGPCGARSRPHAGLGAVGGSLLLPGQGALGTGQPPLGGPRCSPAWVPTSAPSWSSWTVRTTPSMPCSVPLAPIVRLDPVGEDHLASWRCLRPSGATWTVHGRALPSRFYGGFAIARSGVGLLALDRLRIQAATLPA
jgi:hypothetical protein